MRLLYFYMIFIIPFNLYAQIDSPIQYNEAENICAKKTKDLSVQNTLKAIQQSVDKNYQACGYHQLGLHNYKNSNYIKAIEYFNQSFNLRTNIKDKMLWKSKYNLGFTHKKLNNYKKAIEYFIDLHNNSANLDSIKYSNLLIGILEAYKEIGDLSNAYAFSQLLIEFAKNDEAGAKVHLCELLVLYPDSLESAINNAKIAQSILLSTEKKILHKSFSDACNCEAIALDKLKNYTEAKNLYEIAYERSCSTDNSKLSPFCARLNNNISITLKKQGKFEQAISKLYQSFESVKTIHEQEYKYSAFYENLGDTYSEMDSFELSLLHYQKALINLTNNFRTEDIHQNPNPKDTSLFIYSNPDIIRVLHLKATAAYQYYQQNNNIKYLNLANQCYQTAFDFHDQLQQDISTENSRLFQSKNIVPYIENALKVVYQQQENGQNVSKAAFRFMEKNKATVLLQAMNEADALQFANLPESLLEQEKDLKIALTFHNKQLNEAIEYEEVDEIDRLNNLLFDERQSYAQLINNLENNYPDYYRLKYQQNQTQLINVQKALDNQTALLEYFVGDSSIYIVSILKDHTHLFKVKKPSDWKQMINNLRQNISYVYQNDKASFAKNSWRISQLILDPVLCTLPDEITRLQIIPDAELNYIPFEVLLTENVEKNNIQYKNLEYLLKSKSIGYAYSAALWLENKQGATSSKTFSYGGYAPKYFGNEYNDLPIAREKVEVLANTLNGKTYTNEQATTLNFSNDQNSYSILHLATHGILNDQNPLSSYLAFSPIDNYKLYAYDLYNMKINSDLTILHACNTGSGELQKGEGVMSLSRAFTYAGCPSLVMSLWQIPEEATSEITHSFIKYLKNGLTKDVALQKAKLDYLQNENTSKIEASPAYWAGLVVTGNLKALNFD